MPEKDAEPAGTPPEGDPAADDRLVDWAQAVADGRSIDWEQLRSTAPDLASSIAALQLVETVITAHRAPGGGAGEGETQSGSAQPQKATGRPGFAPVPDGATWGPLRLLEQIGEGTFARVYRAFDPALDLEVAVKILRRSTPDAAATERYFDEARRLARVRHPSVLRVYGAARHDGKVGIWSELIEGRTLEECIRTDGPFGPREAAGIGIDLCAGLAAVHGAGLLHRDLKTHNVMRERGGRVVLMDFGSVSDVAGSPARREAGYGTPITVAPELLRGEPATAATDVYALGVLLYRIVTGRYPIEAATLVELIDRQNLGEGTPLREARPDLPAGFVDVVERALDPDAKNRYAGPAALERALRSTMDAGEGRRREPSTAIGSLPLWLRATGVGTAALFLVGVGLLVGQYVERLHEHAPGSAGAARATSPPATAATADLTAAARLYRERDTMREQLSEGALISPGDGLFLEIESAEPMHVYVLDQDDAGRLFVLFPLEGYEPANPLPGGVRHRLPGTRAGRVENWQVTSAGGSEAVTVIGSRHALTDLEQNLARLPHAGSAPQPAGGESGSPLRLRGIGGTESGAPGAGTTAPADASGMLRGLIDGSYRSRDTWVWTLRLKGQPARR